MRRRPASLYFFLFTLIAFALQVFPVTGGFLMFVLAPAWSILLVNAGMLGTGLEAARGRVSRWWLVLPAIFYLGYFALATADRLALQQLDSKFDTANAKVAVGFDPERQSLVFEGESDGARHFARRYRPAIAWWRYPLDRPRWGSDLRPKGGACAIAIRGMSGRFCQLDRGQNPPMPPVVITQREESISIRSLPVRLVTTTIISPDGRHSALEGGYARPLRWLPMPVMGCGLVSSSPAWECFAQFEREWNVPVGAGESLYSGKSEALAKALGVLPES